MTFVFNSELVFISFAVYMVDCILQQQFTFLTSYKLTINNSSEMTTVSITAQFANFFLSSLPERCTSDEYLSGCTS